MARAPTFAAVPNIPLSELNNWQYSTLNALKENVELLTGARSSGQLRAVTKAQLTVAAPSAQTMTNVTAQGVGYTISGASVPALEDYVKLVANVQSLANDVAALRSTVNLLIAQLKA
jgi:hypothetical protein